MATRVATTVVLAGAALTVAVFASTSRISGQARQDPLGPLHPSSLVGKTGESIEPNMLPGSWTAATPYHRPIVRYAFVDAGDRLYVIGGVSNGTRITDVSRYDVGTNTWTPLAPVPVASEGPAAALWNNKIYVAEGDTGDGFFIYDIATNTWSAGPDVPGLTNRYGAAMGAFGGKVYVVGGSATVSNNVQVYTVATNSWALGNVSPTAFFFAGYTAIGQHLYVVGGFAASPAANLTTMMRLDMVTGVWASGPAFTPQRADFALASFGNKLVAIGGELTGGGFFDSTALVDEYLVSTFPGGSWSPSPMTLFSPRQANQASFSSTRKSGGEIWSVGGINGSTFAFMADHVYRPQAPTSFDADPDGRSDLGVFRPSDGTWYLLRSTAGFFGLPFGASTDRIVPADFDGDTIMDIAVFRPSTGFWHILQSFDGTVASLPFGASTDLPVPADYDGDGKADIAVWRPSDGFWHRINSVDGAVVSIQFGMTGDVPTVGDFDGDRKSDLAVFRPSVGSWFRRNSSDGRFVATLFGASTDIPVPADFDGDGRADISVFRPSVGTWFRFNSNNNALVGVPFGSAGDALVAADYDGDGKTDIAVWRPAIGVWFRQLSLTGAVAVTPFGVLGDRPVPAAFVY